MHIPGHVVSTRTADFGAIAQTLEQTDVARTIGSISLDQTVPAIEPAVLTLSACCRNITRMNLASMPMRYLTEEHLHSVRFDHVRDFDIYYVVTEGATAPLLLLLARMPRLKRLSIRGFLPDASADADGPFPALPFALDSLLSAGGVSADAYAHILAQAGGSLRALFLFLFKSPAALARILSAARAATLRTVSLSVGAYGPPSQRAPYVDATAVFLRRCVRVRQLTLQLLQGIPLAGVMAGLPTQSRLHTLRLRDPNVEDATWLAQEVDRGNPALAALRLVELEHDAEEQDDDVREQRAAAAAVLLPACNVRRIRLEA